MAQFWNSRYGEEGMAYGADPNDFLKLSAKYIPVNGSVLCLGEGEGRNAVFLAKQGFLVTGVDMSSVGIEKAKVMAKDQGCLNANFVVADLSSYDIGENKWDAVVSIWCHTPEHLRKSIHERAIKGLKTSGVFILEGYTASNVGRGVGGMFGRPSTNPSLQVLPL
jgi:SAM-dependent methyltransferase